MTDWSLVDSVSAKLEIVSSISNRTNMGIDMWVVVINKVFHKIYDITIYI